MVHFHTVFPLPPGEDALRVCEQLYQIQVVLQGIDTTLEDINQNLADLVAAFKPRKQRRPKPAPAQPSELTDGLF